MSALDNARDDLIAAADAMTADEVHQHPFAALDKIRGLTRELRALIAEHERVTTVTDEMVEAAVKAWWAVPLPGVRGMQGVAAHPEKPSFDEFGEPRNRAAFKAQIQQNSPEEGSTK